MQCRHCGSINSAQSCACVYCGKPISSPRFNPETGSDASRVSIDPRVPIPPIFGNLDTGGLDVAAGNPLSAEQPYLKPPPYADSYAGSDSGAEARDRVPPFAPINYAAYVNPSVRRLQRAGWMVSVFALGLGTGLAGASWLNGFLPGHLAPSASAARAPHLKVPFSVSAVPAFGINEKPYDGIPADQRERAANAGFGELPYDSKLWSASDPAPAVTDSSGGKQSSTASAGGSMGEKLKAVEPEAPPVAKVDGPKAVEAGEMAKAAEGTPLPKMHAPEPRRSAAKSANAAHHTKKVDRNNKEIARIKKQANEELNHIRTESMDAPRDTGAHAGRPARDTEVRAGPGAFAKRTSHALNQCEKLASAYFSGVIRREQCKWRVCKNQWGKNGCPSYQAQNSSNY